MADEPTINVCQYWRTDEPGICPHWDETIPACTLDGADYYPQCNMLGTKFKCSKYAGTGTTSMCVRPDPDRTVGDRKTGNSWVVFPKVDDTGQIIEAGNFDAISKYNEGRCDEAGTAFECTGYAPYHLGFSALQPDDKDGSKGIDADGEFTSISGFDLRLPLGFEIYNRRALLGRCYWWKAAHEDFTVPTYISGAVSPTVVNTVTFRCTNPDEITTNYNDFKLDNQLGMYRAPCNGCKPECPRYAGVCWQYCTDEKMQHGDKVLAEQILEIRYHIKRERWDAAKYEESFQYPDIQAWKGTIQYSTDSIGNIKYLIPSRRAYISNFEDFTVSTNDAMLTEGLQADDGREKYPDLVEELRDVILTPLIKNIFETVDDENVFEVTNLSHETVPIFGDIFYYNAETYGINLKDPDLNLPSQVVEIFRTFDSMEEAKANLEVSFDDIYQDLECTLEFLLLAMPEKIPASTFGKDQNLFYVEMPTFFGDNEIIILNKGSGRWEFDKISFKKIFCGGVVGQTSFSLVGKGEVNYLPDYASDLAAYDNNNGVIGFSFFPLVSATHGDASVLNYVYNDSVRKRLAPNPSYPPSHDTYDMSYKLYKTKAFEDAKILDVSHMRFFGNSGYVLVTILDENKVLSRAIKPWEVSNDIYLNYPSGERTKMEVFDESNDHLEPNQIILRPESVDDFRAPCVGSFITLNKIFIYEKRSFDQLPSLTFEYEVVRETFIGENDNIVYRDAEINETGNNNYQIKKFGTESLTMAAVFRGVTGRLKGQTKTKMITWIRQPYCRDVEIGYGWTKGYTKSTLLPEYNCYGPTGVRVDVNTHYKTYSPMCGDHDLSFNTGTGPMWYPYDDCEDTVNYGITGNLTEQDTSLMEIFGEDWPADPPHGSHDMRMLGPADNYGYTCDTHAQLWACTCDWSFCNLEKKTENIFAGGARYRGGLDYQAKLRALQNYGTLPKFGNVYRDFLRSFRSLDNIDYYYWNGYNFVRKRKWVPMAEFYTSADITRSAQDFPYLLYCSSDYYDDGAGFVHPMGMMLALNKIEGVDIEEKVDVDGAGDPIRYHFEDIFKTHSSLAGLYYPYPKTLYSRLVGGILTPIITWYTYKDYPGAASGDVSIQWAWQEVWKDIERGSVDLENLDCSSYDDLPCCSISNRLGKECLFSIPYLAGGCDSIPEGKHLFLNVEYPEYKYDYKIGEHRLVLEEGEYDITITPPTFTVASGDAGLKIDEFFWAEFDSGPYRAFDVDGNWVGASGVGPNGGTENEYHELYNICTVAPWATELTLFGPGYTDKTITQAVTDDRVIITYDSIGDELKEYYQRGLNISFNTARMDYLAQKETLLEYETYDMVFSTRPTCMDLDDPNPFAALDPGDPYPGVYNLDIDYCMGDVGAETTIAMDFVIRRESDDVSKDSGIGAISRVECEFSYGAFGNILYHIPAVEIVVDGVKYECTTMSISDDSDSLDTKRCSYSWSVPSQDIFDAKKAEADIRKTMMEDNSDIEITNTVMITFRISPTDEELDAGIGDDYLSYTNIINIKNIYLYHANFVESVETINVYERKYNISYGKHGDVPPHGRDTTGSLLYPTALDKSTVYQYDTLAGMVGLSGSAGELQTMNKVRGRIMKECHADKEPIEGSKNLYKWEAKQKEIHDAVAVDSGNTDFVLTANAPPAMEDRLNEIGMSFPRWTCSFSNTMVRPLKAVVQYSTYSPCGHLFSWDFEHMYRFYACGGHGRLYGRSVQDVFDYKYSRVCGPGGVSHSVDALEAYYNGIARTLVNPFEYVQGDLLWRQEVQQRIASSQQGSVIMDFPQAVDNIF